VTAEKRRWVAQTRGVRLERTVGCRRRPGNGSLAATVGPDKLTVAIVGPGGTLAAAVLGPEEVLTATDTPPAPPP